MSIPFLFLNMKTLQTYIREDFKISKHIKYRGSIIHKKYETISGIKNYTFKWETCIRMLPTGFKMIYYDLICIPNTAGGKIYVITEYMYFEQTTNDNQGNTRYIVNLLGAHSSFHPNYRMSVDVHDYLDVLDDYLTDRLNTYLNDREKCDWTHEFDQHCYEFDYDTDIKILKDCCKNKSNYSKHRYTNIYHIPI